MTTFAEKDVVYSDGQINVMPLPEAIMANGFIPETRDAPGMPLAAQHLNWLFRDLYRQTSQLKQNVDKNPALPAWAPIACPMADVPEGYLKCNGAAFDKQKYPELAKAYPSGRLPDLRGEFIRGWDDERGIDEGRAVLSWQEGTAVCMGDPTLSSAQLVSFYNLVNNDSDTLRQALRGERVSIDTSKFRYNAIVATGSGSADIVAMSVRPRNVAFLYIVRAA